MSNLLVMQYGKYKRIQLEASPYSCLLDTTIEINPHQVDAFCSAVSALKTGGIILADEVGLGKTIEAALVIKYVIQSGAKKILLTMPASLRKQWAVELEEKFGYDDKVVKIIDRHAINFNPIGVIDSYLLNPDRLSIVITSYDFSSKLMAEYPTVKWDFVVIDEAHNMRNIFHGTKRAKRLYDRTKGIPKILLTATPLQNRLTDLFGLASFIDGRIFGSEKAFKNQYEEPQNYDELKRNLAPILYRTLRRDVDKYIKFARRECRTFEFELSRDEACLYTLVNDFLKRDNLYSLPDANRTLLTLVIRKLLASSSFALVETFEVIRDRLEKMLAGTKTSTAKEDFEYFWQYVEDEIEEEEDEPEDEELILQKQQIEDELRDVEEIISYAERITENAKITALKTALTAAFAMQQERGISEKVVIFTESKRTQRYIFDELVEAGYSEDDIVLFNGDNTDARTKEIYRIYQVKNFGKTNYGPAVERKHAIVDYFKSHAKVLILTDAGSEGLNLQFCNTVINYDLPWNPMKIEQRIGRCHRYGQLNDVVAINLLNKGNAADKRVYDILSQKFELFNDIFGSSDIALGILESGLNFEREVLRIYQECSTVTDINRAFDKLTRHLEAKRNKKASALRSILLSRTSDEKCADLDATREAIERYLRQVEYWEGIEDEDLGLPPENVWRTPDWGMETLGSHGYLFIGMLANQSKLLFPVLLLCDENGEYIPFDEDELLPEIDKIDDTKIFHYKLDAPGESEMIDRIYDRLTAEMIARYQEENRPLIEYHRHKLQNWVSVQEEQLVIQMSEMVAEAEALAEKYKQAKDFYEKLDIKKELEAKKKQLEKFQSEYHAKRTKIQEDAAAEIAAFEKQFEVDPVLWIRIILKF